MTTNTTTQTKTTPPTNGQFFKDGQWWMQCGPAPYAIKLTDASGKLVPSPEEKEATHEQS
jgi:hypothetical protein